MMLEASKPNSRVIQKKSFKFKADCTQMHAVQTNASSFIAINLNLKPSKHEIMKPSDWKNLSIPLMALGIILLATAAFAVSYYVVPLMGSVHDYPYQGYAFPLTLGGAILLVTGIIALLKHRTHNLSTSRNL
jgi:hypothetical protein